MLRSSNPALRNSAFQSQSGINTGDAMTMRGTVNKCYVMLGLVGVAGVLSYSTPALGVAAFFPALIGTVIAAIALMFKQSWAPVLAPVYALGEGVILGLMSSMFERQYPGIVVEAVSVTFLTFVALLIAYQSRWIQATEKFKMGIFAVTGGIMCFYLVMTIGSLFGFNALSRFFMMNSGASLALSAVISVVAALNLIIDFDFIERGAASGAMPKYMEWYGAFALTVTLVWLYLEILRLLSKMRSRN